MTEEQNIEETIQEEFIQENEPNPVAEDELAKTKAELADQKDKYIRLVAEFDNYKKRTMRERIDLIKTASQEIIQDLLPVIDDFERAEKLSIDQSNEAIFPEGMSLVYQKILNILKSKGLEAMDSNHKEFDANFHEAITEFPSPSDDMRGKVFDTVEKGYSLGDKIIRFAKVVVAK